MDAAKVHLSFNYLPLIGTFVGPLVLIYGARIRSEKAQKISLGILILTAILTLVVFGSGEAAGVGASFLTGPVWTNIQGHRASALPAFAVIEANGIFALFGLINLMRKKALTQWLIIIVLLLSVSAVGLMARTAHLGRSIHSVNAPIAP